MLNKLLACTALSAIVIGSFVKNDAKADSETNLNSSIGHEAHVHMYHQHSTSAESYSPAGVMGDHLHGEGDFMLSYNFKSMLMKGMRDGTNGLTPTQLVSPTGSYAYMMTPTEMSMDMHMIGAMYGVSNEFSVMAMAQYMENSMDMVNRMGVKSKMESSGFGDTEISGLVKLYEDSQSNSKLLGKFGLSLPTGSTDEKGMRMGSYGNLPYAMQLGSGTYDPVFGLTYTDKTDWFSWGAQANAKIRTGKNNEGYRLGDEYSATSWISKSLTEIAAISVRLEAKTTGDIRGADQNTFGMRNMVPTFDPNNYGGDTVNIGFGLNLYDGKGDLKNHKLNFEYLTPIYQDLNGPQMELQHSIMLDYSLIF